MGFFFRNFFMSFLSAFLITVLVNCLVMMLQSRKAVRVRQTKKDREEQALRMLQMRFLTQEESERLLQEALKTLGSQATVHSFFHTEPTVGEVARIMRQARGKKTIIAAGAFPPQVHQFVNTIDTEVVLLDDEATYTKILKPANLFPEILFRPKSKARLTRAALKHMFINRARTRGYVFIGIIILLTSMIVSFPLYYIIFATVLFGLAIVSRVQGVSDSKLI